MMADEVVKVRGPGVPDPRSYRGPRDRWPQIMPHATSWQTRHWLERGEGNPPVDSPVFTGDPQAPTPPTADNDTSIATTAFVKAQGYITSSALERDALLASPTFTGDPKAPTPATADNDTSIATTAFVKAQGYLVSADISGLAPLASPTFTGDPKAPTPATADNDTSIATTAYVKANLANYQPLDADLTSIAG